MENFEILDSPQGPIYLIPAHLQGTPLCPFFNCTPHDFDIFGTDGKHYRLAKTSVVARRSVKLVSLPNTTSMGCFDVAVSATEFGPVQGLPSPCEGMLFIVSGMVIDAPDVGHRADLFAPDTSPDAQVRDEQGHIVGIRRLRVQAR